MESKLSFSILNQLITHFVEFIQPFLLIEFLYNDFFLNTVLRQRVRQRGLIFYRTGAKLQQQSLNKSQSRRLEVEVKKGMREAQIIFGEHLANTSQNVSSPERASGFLSLVTSLLPA